MVEKVKANFKNVIVVMNVGGMVDTSWFKDCKEIPAVLMAWQGGMEGGLAAADVVTGDVNPSGKLVDTYAATLEDYPSTENFHKSVYYVDYNEDIYVGYRYFEDDSWRSGEGQLSVRLRPFPTPALRQKFWVQKRRMERLL